MALQKHPIYIRAFFLILTWFWGTVIAIGALLRFLSSPKKFIFAKNYDCLPTCAVDSQLGLHQSVTIDTVDCGKLKLKYVCNGTKGKPLMLLQHGFPESWVVALDMRGYGDSDKPQRLESYALDYLVEDTSAVIHALGYEKATVMGHDWGGAITWLFAARYPDMCEKIIILNCPHPSVQRKHFTSSLKQLLASWYMFYFLLPYLPEVIMRANDFAMLAATLRGKKGGVKNKNKLTKDDLDVFKYSLNTWESRVASHNYIRANLTYKPKASQGKITPPMLILWGTEDLFLTRQLAVDSTRCAESCQLIFLEGVSHWVQQDVPEQVNEHMRDFLTSS
ncbi:epoxide hydrolase 1-like isoform X2 [Watersipora subatra]|uniref:epoxide hydrolase 1-like isoform X2 n=1 Tax=Watersipora subatra TaxID=2589382 RepID=UPI00355C3C36